MANDAIKKIVKCKIKMAKDNMRIKYKANKKYNEAIILTKILNSLKYECDLLAEEEGLSKEEALERADVIYKITNIIENYEELQPLLEKYFNEKEKREREERQYEI